MKKATTMRIVLAGLVGLTLSHPTDGQSQTQTPPPAGQSTRRTDYGSGGYVSGGERGSVVQVVRDADVQAELSLSPEQRQHVSDILQRVKALENELFEDSRQHHQAQADSRRGR